MLLLSRLYQYSADKFFRFLKSEFFADSFEPEMAFVLQDKSIDSVPDATITQKSFKIVVETKLSDWFYSDQLMRHLQSFGDEEFKVIMTLAPEPMADEKMKSVAEQITEFNASQKYPVVHINTTFENIANAIQDVIDDRDYEMQDVVDDFLNYCYTDSLIKVSDSCFPKSQTSLFSFRTFSTEDRCTSLIQMKLLPFHLQHYSLLMV